MSAKKSGGSVLNSLLDGGSGGWKSKLVLDYHISISNHFSNPKCIIYLRKHLNSPQQSKLYYIYGSTLD